MLSLVYQDIRGDFFKLRSKEIYIITYLSKLAKKKEREAFRKIHGI